MMKYKLFLTLLFFLLTTFNVSASELVITEVYPNPNGDDKTGEFIEIYNNSNEQINISNYSIESEQIKFFGTENFELNSHEFIIIHDDEIDIKTRFPGNYKRAIVKTLTSGGLSNTGDNVTLKKSDVIIDTFQYTQSTDSTSLIRPVINCNLITKTKVIDVIDKNSIGSFENIFDFEELTLELEFNDGTAWKKQLDFNQTSQLQFRLNRSSVCNISESDFSFNAGSETSDLQVLNSISLETNTLIERDLVLTHKPTNSQIVYELIIDNRVSEPAPTPTPVITTTPIIPSPTQLPPDFHNYADIEITEVYPSPNTSEPEWVEIFNYGTQTINLQSFQLKDKTSTQIFSSIVIPTNSYIVIEVPQLKITLNNSGDELFLVNPDFEIISEFKYTSTPKGYSQALIQNAIKITKTATPGKINIYTPQELEKTDVNEDKEKINASLTRYKDIRIDAVYPYPNKGEEEWLKLSNFGNEQVKLDGWSLADKSTKQKLDGIKLEAKSTFELKGDALKITLNNTGDEISLLDPSNILISKLTYPVLLKGQTYIFENNSYQVQSENVSAENRVEGIAVIKDLEQSGLSKVPNQSRKNNTGELGNYKTPITFNKVYDSQKNKMTPPQDLDQDTKVDSKIKLYKDTSLVIASLTGLISTSFGKGIIGFVMKKLH